MLCSGWFKNDSLYLRLQCSSKCCIASRCNGLGLTYKDLIKKIICNTVSKKWIVHQCESYPGTATLKEFLNQELNEDEDDEKFNQELNEDEDDEKFNYCQWDTGDRAILTIFTATNKEYKETLIDVTGDLTRHFYIKKLKITSS